MCRYWGYTGRLYSKCNKNIPFEECYDVLVDTINYLLEKQVWNNPNSSLYNDPKGPEKAFHFVLKRQLSVLLAKKTADKRKSEFKTISIDNIHDKYSDAAEGLFGIANNSEYSELFNYIYDRDSVFDKIVLDTICFSNWTTLQNIVLKIKRIDISNFKYFNTTYNINICDFNDTLKYIENLTSKSLLSEIKKLLYIIRKDWVSE